MGQDSVTKYQNSKLTKDFITENFEWFNEISRNLMIIETNGKKIPNCNTVPKVGNTRWGSSSLESQSSWDTQRSEREAQHICSWIGSYSVALWAKM